MLVADRANAVKVPAHSWFSWVAALLESRFVMQMRCCLSNLTTQIVDSTGIRRISSWQIKLQVLNDLLRHHRSLLRQLLVREERDVHLVGLRLEYPRTVSHVMIVDFELTRASLLLL